jgi:checkpoint serine/threonine-protein kinase
VARARAVELGEGGAAGGVQGARVGGGAQGEVDVALKLESPPCPWEWYLCRAVQGRVPPAARAAFLDPHALLLGAGASVLVMPRGRHGSVQDLLNLFLRRGQRPEESVVMHLAAALLRTLGALHAARVLHNDIKPDNLLVALPEPGAGGDENAAPAVGVQLIDFGRGVDLELLPPGSRLRGDCGTDAFRCVEMREGEEWVWQADAYGAAGVVHCLLFGEYMDVERVVEGATGRARLRIKAAFRRYWAEEVWGEFFSTLLNHVDDAAPPPWEALALRFEAHLAGREAARALRAELSKLAAELMDQRS